MVNPIDVSALLSIPQAAAEKSVSVEAIRQAMNDGTLPAVIVGGRRYVHKDALAAYTPRAYRERPGAKGKGGRPKKVSENISKNF